jgi:hypothetical protein
LSVFPFSNQVPAQTDISNLPAEEMTLSEHPEQEANISSNVNISEHPAEEMSDTNDRFLVLHNWCFVLVSLATLCNFCLFRPGLNDIYALVRSPVSNPIETSEDPLTGHF